jgi:hypothetical protein
LAAFDNQFLVAKPPNLESAPKARAFDPIEPAIDTQPIAKFRCPAIIDFRSNHNRILLGLRHFDQLHPKFLGKQSARGFDEAKVGNVMHHPTAVGIEEHDLDFGLDARGWIAHGLVWRTNARKVKIRKFEL